MKLSPIILFVYNRPWHTRQTIEALQRNELADQSELFIFSDGLKNDEAKIKVEEVKYYIGDIKGFKKVAIIKRESNHGLAKSIINGVTEIINEYKKVVVLEDDLITSPYFLGYMNKALEFYTDKKEIMSISGYNHPPSLMKFPENSPYDVYLNYRNSSWGWATRKDRWERIDWEIQDYNEFKSNKKKQKEFARAGDDMPGMLKAQMENKIDSWAIRFSYAHFKNDCYSVCPVKSYVNNIGHDGSGAHCPKTDKYLNNLSGATKNPYFVANISINNEIVKKFRNVYKISIVSRVKRIIKRALQVWNGLLIKK